MGTNKNELNAEQRQRNIDSLIKGWKERIREMEEGKSEYLKKPEVQQAIARLKQRKANNGGVVTEAL